ncbi:hypothetical protein [Paenibacillus medicaginis]|uniref:Bacteriophage SP-beta YorD domain-containing protein n=1 Tax=Paenibacillus medicaginis TaxID=1470560 RepID=A0ABV5C734_9BACL
MRAVPKIDISGLFIEDVITDDSFTGVVPFYADQPVKSDLTPKEEAERQLEGESQPAGYIVGVPVPVGLYKPRFDFDVWEAYQESISTAGNEYQAAYADWSTLPEKERGEALVYVQQEEPAFWIEGLTPEEIAELTAAPQQEPSETEQLKQRIADLELALAQLVAGKQK